MSRQRTRGSYKLNSVGFPELGKCAACSINKVPVKKYRGQYYCIWDYQRVKDATSSDLSYMNRKVDEFNDVLKKSLGNDNSSTDIDYS